MRRLGVPAEGRYQAVRTTLPSRPQARMRQATVRLAAAAISLAAVPFALRFLGPGSDSTSEPDSESSQPFLHVQNDFRTYETPRKLSRALRAELDRYCAAPLGGLEGRLPLKHREGESPPQLLQVQILIRHGARSAVTAFPGAGSWHNFSCALSDEISEKVRHWPEVFRLKAEGPSARFAPRKKAAWYPATEAGSTICKRGQLINAGYTHLMTLGRSLRAAYSETGLFDGLQPENLYARATDFDRTRASTASLLQGLLDLELTTRSAPWREPFPIAYRWPPAEEEMMGIGLIGGPGQQLEANHSNAMPCSWGRSSCPRAAMLSLSQRASFQVAKNTLGGLERLLGHDVAGELRHGRQTITNLADGLEAPLCDHAPLPCAEGRCIGNSLARQVLVEADRKFSDRFTGSDGGLEATQLAFYPLAAEVLRRMNEAAYGDGTAEKVVVLGGHDTTVAPLGAILKIWDQKWPPFASRIVFELWKLTPSSPPAVRVLVDGQPMTHRIPGCREKGHLYSAKLCALDHFATTVQELLGGFSDIQSACAPTPVAA